MKLEGQVAIVTGASSGMGRETAKLYAAEGAKVVGFARREGRLKEVEEAITAAGGVFVPYVGDITKVADIDGVVDFTVKKFGKVDILLNATGQNDDFVPIERLSDEWYAEMMDINLNGPVKLMRAAIREMVKNEHGIIVNISSDGGLKGGICGLSYITAKHGLIGATKNVAVWYQPRGIRCNAICPGGFATECDAKNPDEWGKTRAYWAASTGIEFLGDPKRVASVALFLASDDSHDVNGVALPVDSGWAAV